MAQLDDRAILDAAVAALQLRLLDEAANAQRAAFRAGTTAAELEMGQEGLYDPDAQEFIRALEFRAVRTFTSDFSRQVEDAIQEGIRNGEREEAIARRLRGLTDRSEARLRTIARTETNRAANHGRLSGWLKTGVVRYKVAIATVDDRTRLDHLEADGEEVPIHSAFTQGAAAGMVAPPWAPNCRCTIAPVTRFEDPAASQTRRDAVQEAMDRRLAGLGAADRAIRGLRAIEDRHAGRMAAILRPWSDRLIREADPLPARP